MRARPYIPGAVWQRRTGSSVADVEAGEDLAGLAGGGARPGSRSAPDRRSDEGGAARAHPVARRLARHARVEAVVVLAAAHLVRCTSALVAQEMGVPGAGGAAAGVGGRLAGVLGRRALTGARRAAHLGRGAGAGGAGEGVAPRRRPGRGSPRGASRPCPAPGCPSPSGGRPCRACRRRSPPGGGPPCRAPRRARRCCSAPRRGGRCGSAAPPQAGASAMARIAKNETAGRIRRRMECSSGRHGSRARRPPLQGESGSRVRLSRAEFHASWKIRTGVSRPRTRSGSLSDGGSLERRPAATPPGRATPPP